MSETDSETDVTPVEETATSEPVAEEPEARVEPPQRQRSGNSVAWLAFLFAIIAVAASGYVAWQDWRGASDTSADDQRG